VQNATPGELAWFLRNRNLAKGMPSWSGIPEERRRQIVTYLKTLGVGATAEDVTAIPSANNQAQ
jgi:hypothetical protein